MNVADRQFPADPHFINRRLAFFVVSDSLVDQHGQ